jgi:hypothetical protein
MTQFPQSKENPPHLNIQLSDKVMKQLFGLSFMQFVKDHRFLYPKTDNSQTGRGEFLSYSETEIVKAVQILYNYQLLKKRGYDADDCRAGHGLISHSNYVEMSQSPWWPNFSEKFESITHIPLNDFIKPYVLPVSSAGVVDYGNNTKDIITRTRKP